MVKKSEFSRFRQVSPMKFFARLFILLGIVAVLYSFIQIILHYTQNNWATFTEYLSYIFLEVDERFVFIISLFILLIGGVLLYKVNKHVRVFYCMFNCLYFK